VKSAIPHPRIMGIIRECGGKMHMHDQLWEEAATDFFEVCGCVGVGVCGGGVSGGGGVCGFGGIGLWAWAARREGGRCDMK
jgi:hypothetical protein